MLRAMIRNHVRLLGLGGLVASLLACASTPTDKVERSADSIISGIASTSDQDAVILLVQTDLKTSFASCSGSLIAPNLVLTARHCVAAVNEDPFGCDQDGNLLPGSTGGKAGADFPVKNFYIFTGVNRPNFNSNQINVAAYGKKIFHDDSKVLCSHDLALLLLDRDIENAQIYPLRLDGDPVVGETMTAIGWGITNTTDSPKVRQQRTGIPVLQVGPFAGSVQKQIGPIPQNDFAVGEAICSGDSGGPALAESTNSIIGVVSRGGNSSQSQVPKDHCIGSDTTNEYTKVAPFKDLILSAFAEAGHDPWYEGGPDPRLGKTGVDCTDPTTCRGNLCIDSLCSQSCDADTPCPDGYDCSTKGGANACKPHDVVQKENDATASASSSGCGCDAVGVANSRSTLWLAGAAIALMAWRRRRTA